MAFSMNPTKLPKTDSIQELAQFWDTHDVTDFEDELEEVTGRVFERATSVEVRLDPREANALKDLAQSKGIALEELVHQWVAEKIQAS
jgi:predicted DNA binding CopG/RHH family protein